MRWKMWRVVKRMYGSSKSAVLLDGERSEAFDVEQGVAQGCSLSPICFCFRFSLTEEADAGFILSSGGRLGGLLFADDFVGASESKHQLQRLIDVVYAHCYKWRLKANVSKRAVMVFARESLDGAWKWGERFCLECLSTHTWVLTLLVLGHGVSISGR